MRICLVAWVVASSAWATGERVRLSAGAEPLREALCVSMNCVEAGPAEAVVSAASRGGSLEVSLTARGVTRLVASVPLRGGKAPSVVDVVTASAKVLAVIEGRDAAPPTAKEKPTPRRRPLRLVARR